MTIDVDFLEDATKQLITLGVAVARHIHDRITTEPDIDLVKASKAFETVNRGTRRAILLARKLNEAPRRATVRRQIIRAVEDTIQREADGDDETAALETEFLDRLDTLDIEEDLYDRPVKDIVTDIVHDLGLGAMPGTHPWKRRTPAEVATLHTRAAAPHPSPREPAANHPGADPTPPPYRPQRSTPAADRPSPTSPR